jgi:hypothetical protein
LRPCTIEDFKGSENSFKIDSGGVIDSLFCPMNLTEIKIKNNKYLNPEDHKYFGILFSECYDDNPFGAVCEKNKTKI